MLRQLSSSHGNSQSMVHEIHHISMKHVHKLSSPHDNRQSMVIHPKGMNYAPSVVFVS